METTVAQRLLHMVRVVYYMIRKGVSKRKLTMDLHLLLQRGKIAGKALGNLMTFHHHHHHHQDHYSGTSSAASAFFCRSMDPNLSFSNPREVEFSCSNTTSYPSFHLKRRKHRHRNNNVNQYSDYDVAEMAKVFDMLNSEASDAESAAATPMWSFGKSPAVVRQLRITDSPFPIREEEGEADGRVDQEAEEFIRRFYEQLRLQRSVANTPEYSFRG